MDDEEISLRDASNNHVLYNIKLTKKFGSASSYHLVCEMMMLCPKSTQSQHSRRSSPFADSIVFNL